MLGHQLVQSLRCRHEIHATLRSCFDAYRGIAEFLPDSVHYGVDVRDYPAIKRVAESVRPDAVINAVGVVKQRDEATSIDGLEINALLPHRLAVTCAEVGARLVQLSTDCVFSGRKGNYSETDIADPADIYGRSKLLGEVEAEGCVTLRTSIIGLELSTKKSLVEWFLAQHGPIRGFCKAIYSGFTTLEMARIIEHVLVRRPNKSGLYHVSSEPIDKYTLLTKLRNRLGRNTEILPDDEFICHRSLNSERFQAEFAYNPPSWDKMIDELADQVEERYL